MIVELHQLKDQLGFTPDLGGEDDELMQRKLAAAQGMIERRLGYRITDRFGGVEQEPIPSALVEAILQLAAWWYESREAAGDGARAMPWGVSEIIDDYRDWSFG